ncbi:MULTISPECIES: M1 family metallopeptidase [unclassified Amycolatopsis]|uniref:M1 family metallopeptidase n=1 Tax=unclassified Amycolatopsis TaxID=2618356 RepID=UPI003451C5C0
MLKRVWATAVATGSILVLISGTAVAAPSPGSDGAGDPLFPQDGNGGYRVSHYDVALDYDPAKPDHLTGDTAADAVATQDLSRFDLDLEGLTVQSVTVAGAPAAFTCTGEHELVITPAKPLRRGQSFRVRVRYQGTPGFFWMTADDAGAVHAFGEPHSASSWYPVNDHPSDKATFHLAVTMPDRPGWAVVGNGVPAPPVVRDGRKTFSWTENHPVASYLTGVVIDRMTVHTGHLADGTPVVDAYTTGAEAAKPFEDRLPEVLGFLSSRFGKYPFSAAGGVFYPGGTGGGFEMQERPVYPGGVPPEQFTDIVHEQAHQWFGDSVAVARWSDICLKECFATYADGCGGRRRRATTSTPTTAPRSPAPARTSGRSRSRTRVPASTAAPTPSARSCCTRCAAPSATPCSSGPCVISSRSTATPTPPGPTSSTSRPRSTATTSPASSPRGPTAP